jgi:hypothetical protein
MSRTPQCLEVDTICQPILVPPFEAFKIRGVQLNLDDGVQLSLMHALQPARPAHLRAPLARAARPPTRSWTWAHRHKWAPQDQQDK